MWIVRSASPSSQRPSRGAQMKITYNDELLVSVSEDATIMVWKVSDKEGRGLKRDREVAWAEEILITKSDLEEKVSCQVNHIVFEGRDRSPQYILS